MNPFTNCRETLAWSPPRFSIRVRISFIKTRYRTQKVDSSLWLTGNVIKPRHPRVTLTLDYPISLAVHKFHACQYFLMFANSTSLGWLMLQRWQKSSLDYWLITLWGNSHWPQYRLGLGHYSAWVLCNASGSWATPVLGRKIRPLQQSISRKIIGLERAIITERILVRCRSYWELLTN